MNFYEILLLVGQQEEVGMSLFLSSSTSKPEPRYYQRDVQAAKDLITHSWKPVILTGAGISASSGIPTFRGQRDGLWNTMNWMRYSHSLARKLNPSGVFEAHEKLRSLVDFCELNAGHTAIAKLCQQIPKARVFTQNVDGLHARSGIKAYELHGTLHVFVCQNGCGHSIKAERGKTLLFKDATCSCGGKLHHDTVLFGDDVRHLPLLIESLQECDLVILAGTSGTVTDTKGIAQYMHENKVPLIEINPAAMTPSRIYSTFYFRNPAEVILPKLL